MKFSKIFFLLLFGFALTLQSGCSEPGNTVVEATTLTPEQEAQMGDLSNDIGESMSMTPGQE